MFHSKLILLIFQDVVKNVFKVYVLSQIKNYPITWLGYWRETDLHWSISEDYGDRLNDPFERVLHKTISLL